MFAVYDGHGGSECCNFLKEKLHSYLLTNFDPTNFQTSLKRSCIDLDDEFLRKAKTDFYCDTSGSCALVLLAVGNQFTNTR